MEKIRKPATSTNNGGELDNTASQTISGNKVFSGEVKMNGRTDGVAPSAGQIGQYVEWTTISTTAPATDIVATVGAADAGQITLTAGVWDISASALFNTSSSNTFTYGTLWIGTAPGASITGRDLARNYVNQVPVVSGTTNWSLQTPVFRVNLSTTQTFYLKTQNGYSGAGTVSIVYPLLRATRIA